jgi:hypothetical protein
MAHAQEIKYRCKNSPCIPWDHDQPTEPIHDGSSGNQEQPENDLNMHNALHYASSSYASAVKQKTEERELIFF